MNRLYYILIISSFYILSSCGDSNKTASKAASLTAQEPDIELAKFDKVIAEKRVVSSDDQPEEVKEVEKEVVSTKVDPIKEETPARKPKTEVTTKKKKPAPKKKKAPKYAKIEFDSVVHRLPEITEGDKFKDEFHFTNTGKIPLTITFATASCGCTLPSYPFLDIAPGDSDVIRVEYNSVGKEGPQEAEITVSANTYPKEMILKMVFDVNEKEKIEVDTTGQE